MGGVNPCEDVRGGVRKCNWGACLKPLKRHANETKNDFRDRRYCNREHYLSSRQPPDSTCANINCGKEISGHRKYCDRRCYTEATKPVLPPERKCRYCKKILVIREGEAIHGFSVRKHCNITCSRGSKYQLATGLMCGCGKLLIKQQGESVDQFSRRRSCNRLHTGHWFRFRGLPVKLTDFAGIVHRGALFIRLRKAGIRPGEEIPINLLRRS